MRASATSLISCEITRDKAIYAPVVRASVPAHVEARNALISLDSRRVYRILVLTAFAEITPMTAIAATHLLPSHGASLA